MRISAPQYALMSGCRFEISLKIGEKNEKLLAEVVNELHKEDADSEYGCKFYAKEKPVQRMIE